MLTILSLLVNNIAVTLVLDCTYEFIIEMTIPYLMHWTYDQVNVVLDNQIQCLMIWKLLIIFDRYFYSKNVSLNLTPSLYIFSPYYLAN